MSAPSNKSPSADMTVAFGPASKSASESAEFLQQRLRAFSGLMGAVLAGVYVIGFVVILVALPEQLAAAHKHPVKLHNAAIAFEMAFVWYALGRWRLSLRFLQGLDVAVSATIVVPAALAFAK